MSTKRTNGLRIIELSNKYNVAKGGIVVNYADKVNADSSNQPVTTYHEKKINRTLYRVTNIYKGEIDFARAIEDLTITKILRDENVLQACLE